MLASFLKTNGCTGLITTRHQSPLSFVPFIISCSCWLSIYWHKDLYKYIVWSKPILEIHLKLHYIVTFITSITHCPWLFSSNRTKSVEEYISRSSLARCSLAHGIHCLIFSQIPPNSPFSKIIRRFSHKENFYEMVCLCCPIQNRSIILLLYTRWWSL